MKNPVIYVFLNKELHMTTGKAAAQVAHAVAMSIITSSDLRKKQWSNAIHRAIIVLDARTGDHIQNIDYYLKERGVQTSLIIDEGVNEIDGYVETALATTVLDKDDEKTKQIFESFSTYRDVVKVTTEFER